MNEKKKLDRLFQEKFKDFEYEPSEKVWQNIEAALKEEKEDRKVIPFWFWLSGISAALLIGFFAFNAFFGNGIPNPQDGIVNGENGIKNSGGTSSGDAVVNRSGKKETEINTIDPAKKYTVTGSGTATQAEDNTGENTQHNSSGLNNPTDAVAAGRASATKNNKKSSGTVNGINGTSNAVADRSNTHSGKNGNANKENAIQTAVAERSGKSAESKTNTKNTTGHNSTEQGIAYGAGHSQLKKKNIKRIGLPDTAKDAVAAAKPVPHKTNTQAQSGIIYKNTTESIAASGKVKKGKPGTVNSTNNNEPANTTAIAAHEKNNTIENINTNSVPTVSTSATAVPENAVAAAKKEETGTDGKKLEETAIATVEPNALEELLLQNEKEKLVTAETKLNRWQITSSVAPIYFSSTANSGSSIDKQFADNSKTYENNMSFGVGVNYAVSKKINIRTGINKFTLGYNTNDVAFYAGLQSQGLQNVTSSGNNAHIEIVNKNVPSDGLLPFESDIQNSNQGVISQRMGYIEVPMEMTYSLVNKKFGVTVIGGLSTLFLNENKVSVVSSAMSADLGEANNLSNVHFSSNIGLGFRYSFWKAFNLNFEPMLKYQLKTFTNDVGNFKPYFIGLYSGLSFEF